MDIRQLSDAELESMIAEHLATLRKAPSTPARLFLEDGERSREV